MVYIGFVFVFGLGDDDVFFESDVEFGCDVDGFGLWFE